MKVSKANLRSCSLSRGPILSASFIRPPVVSPNLDLAPKLSRIKVDDTFTLTTTNDENLPKVEAEEVDTLFRVLGIHYAIPTAEMMLIVTG